MMMKILFVILNTLAFLGFIFVDLVAPIPSFLQFENIVYASIFLICMILYMSNYLKTSYSLAMISSLFISGRISRSVISSDGNLLGLWQDHLAVIIILLIIASLSFYGITKSKK